jgi:threonine/homoserine/homoserine lactone efflux protein
MTGELEAQAYAVLATSAVLLLVLVTGGVVYLTAIEWRDKRQRAQEALDNRTPVSKRKGKNKGKK